MKTKCFCHTFLPGRRGSKPGLPIFACLFLAAVCLGQTRAAELKVLKMGLGYGTVTGTVTGGGTPIDCGSGCDAMLASGTMVNLTAAAMDPNSRFVGWEGDATGSAASTSITMSGDRAVRAIFELMPPSPTTRAIPELTDFTPGGIQTYLSANLQVTNAARFLAALPAQYRTNWILMSRSESLQTGTATYPRLLLPSTNAQAVFTIGLSQHNSYPGAHPEAIEYMQWDPAQKNFRFHEIVLTALPAMDNTVPVSGGGTTFRYPPRSRGVSVDDAKCFNCHSTRNILNLDRSVIPPVPGPFPATDGVPAGTVGSKNKPNWDAYDSWGGMLPFNRDRIYQGSVEAAAFRHLFNFWNWRGSPGNEAVRQVLEQLALQSLHAATGPHSITRDTNSVADAAHIRFGFDALPPIATTTKTVGYSFDNPAVAAAPIAQGGRYVTLRHSNANPLPANDTYADPGSDEGRGVQFFDLLGGLDGNLNPQRIADELIRHRFATGSHAIDVRPIALAIARGLIRINAAGNTVVSTPALTIDLGFFESRHGGLRINDLVADTRARAEGLPRRKAEIEKKNLDRTEDIYLKNADRAVAGGANGLIQQYGAATPAGATPTVPVQRQEVFRRPIDLGRGDRTAMSGVYVNPTSGVYVDRELYGTDPVPTSANYVNLNTEKIALFRFFLEPLGVSVDKWSMGVRGRSRTYTFADVFDSYLDVFRGTLRNSLIDPMDLVPGLSNPDDDTQLIAAINSTLGSLPLPNAVPTYTDVQRIFNKSCIECHGGLGYPPYFDYGNFVDFSEDENPPSPLPPMPSPRLLRSYDLASTLTAGGLTFGIYERITRTSENCRPGSIELMPCGGPPLSQADVQTIRRWIVGTPSRPSTTGDPHITTVEGINYDFQAAGEFVLLRDEYLEIQARHTAVTTAAPVGPNPHTELTSCVSVNGAAAIRYGAHRITYQPNLSGQPDPAGLQLRVDGKLVEMGARGIIPLPSGARIIRTAAPGGIQIEAPGNAVIVITPGWWPAHQIWYLDIDTRNVRATMGLMGVIAPGNWLPALPDGSWLGPRPADLSQRFQDLYIKFGNAWRVTDATSLFDYAPGTSAKTFTIESFPNFDPAQPCTVPGPGGGTNRPPVVALTQAEAEACCAGILDPIRRANCIQDVMVTGECGFGKTYLMAEQIGRNVYPTIPALVLPADRATNLVGPVTFTWNHASDRDGDSLNYRFYIWPAGERPNNNDATPVVLTAGLLDAGSSCTRTVGWLGCLLLIALILLMLKKKPSPSAALVLAMLAVAALVLYFRRPAPASAPASQLVARTVANLQPGKAYSWKVIVEDGRGGTVESETRRLEMK